MKTVWKSELIATNVQHIAVPFGAELLTAREQNERICIWYRCDPNAPKDQIPIAIVRTGHAAPEDGRYVGTAFLSGGTMAFHVFAKP